MVKRGKSVVLVPVWLVVMLVLVELHSRDGPSNSIMKEQFSPHGEG